MIQVTFLTNNGKVVERAGEQQLAAGFAARTGRYSVQVRRGLCGTCKCRIEQGLEHTDAVKPKERKHLTEEQFKAGYRMACQTFMSGDVSVSWVPMAERGVAPARVEPDAAAVVPLSDDPALEPTRE